MGNVDTDFGLSTGAVMEQSRHRQTDRQDA